MSCGNKFFFHKINFMGGRASTLTFKSADFKVSKGLFIALFIPPVCLSPPYHLLRHLAKRRPATPTACRGRGIIRTGASSLLGWHDFRLNDRRVFKLKVLLRLLSQLRVAIRLLQVQLSRRRLRIKNQCQNWYRKRSRKSSKIMFL